MLINAIYDHGRIIWPDNVKLKDEKIPIVVDVPDKEINLQQGELDISGLHPRVWEMLNKINKVLGSDYVYHFTHKTDKELFPEALEESGKYGI